MGNSIIRNNQQDNLQKLLIDFKQDLKRQRANLISRQFDVFDQFSEICQQNNFDQNQLSPSDKYASQSIEKYLKQKKFRNIKYVEANQQSNTEINDQAKAEINMLKKFPNKQSVIKFINSYDDNQDYIIIQLQACQTNLEQILQKKKTLSENTIIKFAYKIFIGICNIHHENVKIFDLKPENILIDYFGQAVLSDFGLSKQLKQDQSTVTQPNGNFQYKAPEGIDFNKYLFEQQVKGFIFNSNKLSKQADLFSFALILFRMLTDQKAIFDRFASQGCNIDILNLDRKLKYKNELNQIIQGLTQLDPKKRLDSMTVLLILQQIYNQEFQQDTQGLREEQIQSNFKCQNIQYFISNDKDHVIPIYEENTKEKKSRIQLS
ncbi:hypothetical protein ABPG72_010497 [Tetrahymena utriculariae]